MSWILVPIALVAGFQTTDEAKAQDNARLKAAMSATGFKFETTTSGLSYSVIFDHGGGKSQTVFVSIDGSPVGNHRYHAIYTGVWTGAKEPSAEIVKKMLMNTKKLGTFYSFKDSQGNWSVRFMVQYDF